MKRNDTSKPFFDAHGATRAVAAASDVDVPDRDNPATVASDWNDAIASHSYAELRRKLAQRRHRGPQKAPTKVPTTLRLPRDTLVRWRASGPGWQTRMAELLEKRAP